MSGVKVFTKYVTVGPLRIHMTSAGPPKAPTFVFVHGIGVSHQYFLPLLQVLGKDCQVVAIDLPGFGKSSHPKRAFTIRELGEIVGRVIAEEAIENPILVGHSMGCQVVTALERQQPALSNKLILMSPSVDPKRRNALVHFIELLLDAYREPLKLKLLILRNYVSCGLPHYLRTLRYMLTDHIEDRLPACQAKVLVTRGENDPIIAKKWAQKAAQLARGTYIEIPNAAHVTQFTQPQVMGQICKEFVKTK